MTATDGRIKPQSISDDVRALRKALDAGPTEGEWTVQALNLSPHHDTGIRVSGESVSGYAAVLNTRWPHEKQREEQRANARWIATSNPARLRRVLDTMQAMGEALKLAEDVLARFPFSAEIWPNGMHPNAGITQIRAALALYEGKK